MAMLRSQIDSVNTQLKTEFRSGDSQNKSGVVFPTMILCADSMHSHFKIQQKYPQEYDTFSLKNGIIRLITNIISKG